MEILLLKHKYLSAPARADSPPPKRRGEGNLKAHFLVWREGAIIAEWFTSRFDSHLNTTLLWLTFSQGINQLSFYYFPGYSFAVCH